MKRKLFFRLSIISAVLFFAVQLFAQTATAPASGTGTSGDPYQITTLENLYWITASDAVVSSPTQAERWAAYYEQTADIDASATSGWDGGAGWSPIGTYTLLFTGNYNGQGYSVDGIFINRPSTDYVGFFGAVQGAISNLGLTDLDITGKNETGGMTGFCQYAATNISWCYTTGTVQGIWGVGGLIGYRYGGTVQYCYSECNVTGSDDTGGFLGSNRGGGSTINNCYCRGDVSRVSGETSTAIGGFLGDAWQGGTFSYCYSTGKVIYIDAINPTDKGIVGSWDEVGTFTSNYWDTETSLQTSTGNTAIATGKTTDEMQTSSTFVGWNFTTNWVLDNNNDGYPYLSWQTFPMQLVFTTTAGSQSIQLPLYGTVDCTVDWGDGSPTEDFTTAGDALHQFAAADTYTVEISGNLTHFGKPETYWVGRTYLIEVPSFGKIGLTSLKRAFLYAYNLVSVAAGIPETITDMSYAFSQIDGATSITNLNQWDVSHVTNMEHMFEGYINFNQDISGWNTNSVTNMESMFEYCENFDQPIGSWNVGSSTNMKNMFRESAFNSDISNWDVSKVTNMEGMFDQSSFNKPIGNWDVSNVSNMKRFFAESPFNQNIGAWDVSKVTDMSYMFAANSDFNQNIGAWDVSKVTTMQEMFVQAPAFNQDIGAWDVSKVTTMYGMFSQASAFNQDITGWDVSNVNSMFGMFAGATAFDQNLGSWNITSVTTMEYMFMMSSLSTANYDALLTGWAAQDVKNSVLFDAGNSTYSAAASSARQSLIDDHSWTISDDGNSATDGITWDGSESSDWNTQANWVENTVPTISDYAVIENTGNPPIITTTANCSDLFVKSSATLTINSGGSLISNGGIANNGIINIQRSIPDGEWHLISIPCSGITANTFLGDYLQYWDEPEQLWVDITDETTVLSPVQGYSLWGMAKNTSYTFSGKPNTGNQSIPLTSSGSGVETSYGFNLVGNPYPSSINWDLLQPTYGTAYIWDASAASGAGDYLEWNAGSGGTQNIPPMQGFFVYTDGTNETLNITNNHRTHSGAANFYKSSNDLSNVLVLAASNGNYADELTIRFDAMAQVGFELTKDSWKLISSGAGVSQLYSICPSGKLAIDVRPECEIIQLGFANDQPGVYSIDIKEIADLPEVYLEDTKTNKFHNLQSGKYEFSWDPDIDDETRFKLHLNAVGINENQISESDILIYAADGNIYIHAGQHAALHSGTQNTYGTSEHAPMLSITDITGRTLLHQQLPGDDFITIPVNLQTGVYVVMVQTGNDIKTEKIFLK